MGRLGSKRLTGGFAEGSVRAAVEVARLDPRITDIAVLPWQEMLDHIYLRQHATG